MHDRTPDRDGPENSRWPLPRVDNRFVIAVAFVLMCSGILIGGHLYGRYLASFKSPGFDSTITELRSQAQRQKRQNDALSAERTAMETKLEKAQAALDSIMPAPNTYTIKPNQTLIVGNGHLPVGMVGAPGNDAIILSRTALQAVGVDRHDYRPRHNDDGSGNHRKKRNRSRFC